jgi:hypothetical protein
MINPKLMGVSSLFAWRDGSEYINKFTTFQNDIMMSRGQWIAAGYWNPIRGSDKSSNPDISYASHSL